MHILHRRVFAKHLFFKVGIALLLILVLAAVTFAEATITVTGPTWNNPGYTWTVSVTAMSNPDKLVCLTINGAATPCACNSPACDATTGLGTWVCTQATNVPNGTWNIDSWTAGGGSSCGGDKNATGEKSGSFGPNAITLARFQAARLGQASSPLLLPAVALGLAALLGAAVVVRRRL